MADYAPDLLMFDAIGPLSFRGLETLRQGWQLCLDSTVGPLALEHHDLEVMVADDLAVATSLMTFQATSKARGIELHSTMRNTTVLRRREGSWKIVHGHGSVPFDPISEKALVDLRLDS